MNGHFQQDTLYPLSTEPAEGYGADPLTRTGEAIIVRDASPIRSLADLRGRRVGFTRGSSSHNLTVAALDARIERMIEEGGGTPVNNLTVASVSDGTVGA